MVCSQLSKPADGPTLATTVGGEHRIVLNGTATEGRLMVVKSALRAGTACPVHVHPDDDTTIIVLAGEVVAWAGADKWTAVAGDTVFFARDVPHAYYILDDAELMTIYTPSGMELLFEATTPTGHVVLGPPLNAHDLMPADVLA